MRRAVILAVLLCACDRAGDAAPSAEDTPPPSAVTEAPKQTPGEPVTPPPSAPSEVYAQRLTDELFWLDRAALTVALAEALAGHIRIEPADTGWKIVELRAGSLAEVLGLRAGDVVRTVDTRELPDADAWLAVVRSLQLREAFAVAIDRDGRPMTLRYELRNDPPDVPREVVAQLLAVVKTGVSIDGDRIEIDRAILRQLAGPSAAARLRRAHRRDLLAALGFPAATIVAVADRSLSGVEEATAALAGQANAREFNVDLGADGTLPSRRVVVVVEGRIVEWDLESVLARLPIIGAVEPETREPASPDPGIRTPAIPEPGTPDPLAVDAATALGIVTVDATHFTMPAKARDELLADGSALAKSARVVPSLVDGNIVGFKLYSIRRGSLPNAFGLNNGDTITAINGIDLESAEDMLEVYGKLRKAKKLVIELQRRGAPLTLTVTFE